MSGANIRGMGTGGSGGTVESNASVKTSNKHGPDFRAPRQAAKRLCSVAAYPNEEPSAVAALDSTNITPRALVVS